jgi:hypothetical protein
VTAAPVLEPSKGRLRIAERTLAALVAHTADPVAAALEDGAEEQLTALRAAGVIEGGRAHPAIADGLAAIVQPSLCTLELEYSGKAMRGWVSTEGAALLLPAQEGDERRTLLALHPTLLPEALARLVDLGPRPRPEATAPVAVEAVADVRRRWRLSAAWQGGGARLEVLDAADGLWLLHDTLAWPVTPTFVWRHIVRLLMRRGG